jgi:hypothetical protein
MRRLILLVPFVWFIFTAAVPSLLNALDLCPQEIRMEVLYKKKELLKDLKDVEEKLAVQEGRVGEASRGCNQDLDSSFKRQADGEFDRLDSLREQKRRIKGDLTDLELFVKAYNAGRVPEWWFVRGRLFVKAEPKNAKIRILNIEEKFSQGMELEPGEYVVEVSARGYRTKKSKVDMSKEYREITVELVRR